jgi:hypothetical protein
VVLEGELRRRLFASQQFAFTRFKLKKEQDGSPPRCFHLMLHENLPVDI